MPHILQCDQFEEEEECNSDSEPVLVFGPDTETGEARSIWVDHQCVWRLWKAGDDGYDAATHNGVHGCFLAEQDTAGEQSKLGDDNADALITLSLGQFMIIILSVL
jgi:hypothetical protein